ncbi:hypothetical protein QR680_013975 [Steinernema hermaphroditum]|uniref:ShKT domain-containing protein n=2 Tax=Steinernema hermaphroditum TaxID=289476 RepID=A0AA39I7A8_9BILA|nr:hypothetical protein QR680_013975 [Steinernema hermaphroditum]
MASFGVLLALLVIQSEATTTSTSATPPSTPVISFNFSSTLPQTQPTENGTTRGILSATDTTQKSSVSSTSPPQKSPYPLDASQSKAATNATTISPRITDMPTSPAIGSRTNAQKLPELAKSTTTTTVAPTKVTKSATEQPCIDHVSNCLRNRRLCSHPRYLEHFKRNCAKTCGFCGSPAPPAPVCRDQSPSCRTFERNGFCKSQFYSLRMKKMQCARTCGLC